MRATYFAFSPEFHACILQLLHCNRLVITRTTLCVRDEECALSAYTPHDAAAALAEHVSHRLDLEMFLQRDESDGRYHKQHGGAVVRARGASSCTLRLNMHAVCVNHHCARS